MSLPISHRATRTSGTRTAQPSLREAASASPQRTARAASASPQRTARAAGRHRSVMQLLLGGLAQLLFVALCAMAPGCAADPNTSSDERVESQGAPILNQAAAIGNIALEIPGLPIPAEIGQLKDYWDHAKKGKELLDDYQACVSQGYDQSKCAAQKVLWPGICYFWADAMIGMTPGWGILGLPLEQACLGEPTLKCCKYTPDQQFCHSAFNTEAPINCEGNPTTDSADSFGPCLAPANGIGCLCCYIPICGSTCPGGGGSGGSGVGDPPGADAWRFNYLAKSIADQTPDQFDEDFIAFAMFIGCQSHTQALLEMAPFAGDDFLNPNYPNAGSSYHVEDNNPEARYLRALITLAVRRVLAGIPNVAARWAYIYSRTWTQTQKDAYLAGQPDPDATLLSWLGPKGFSLLQGAQPDFYQLLVVPLPGETPEPPSPPSVAGCQTCAPPSGLALNVVMSGNTATLSPTFVDPEAATNTTGAYTIAVDWGDGRVQGFPYVTGLASTHSFQHEYAAPGDYTIQAWVQNSCGLRDAIDEVVTVTQGGGNPGGPSVSTIDLDLLVTITANVHGIVALDVEAIDEQNQSHPVGRYWAHPVAAGFTTVTFDLSTQPLVWHSQGKVAALRLKPYHVNGSSVSFREMTLASVTFGLYTSEGATPSSVTYPLTNRDVRIYNTGATVPIAPVMQYGTGALRLPILNAEILIAVPSSTTPNPEAAYGCRPDFALDPPTMVTADGGCRDIATGLVWSHQSAQKITWHDMMWDSALAGNVAPDGFDYGRVSDYPGQYPLPTTQIPDNSTTNFCHELNQGGYADWRAPTEAEVISVFGVQKALAYFPHDTADVVMTATTWSPTPNTAIGRKLAGGSGSTAFPDKSSVQRALCVRSDPLPPTHHCKVQTDGGTVFVNQNGGCFDTRSAGLVWSKASVLPKTWHQAVWGSALAGNAPPDAFDFGKTNDYAGGTTPSIPDASTENYCHELVEGGFSDWRLPTAPELNAVRGSALALKYFGFQTDEYFQSSTTGVSGTSTIVKLALDSGAQTIVAKTVLERVVCVRTVQPCETVDADGDGYGACADCDDQNAAANPGAVEVCNGFDDDCNGIVDTDGPNGCPTCTDGLQNQGETDVDCGGPCAACPGCDDGIQNQGEQGVDCGGPCAPCATCNDGIQNQGEQGVDCGGPCAPCATCNDGVQNQSEQGIDCGGPCAPCPTCDDNIQNQGEEDIDCGGPCAPCPTCTDGILNQGETATDCGGPCDPCPTCNDGILNQGEEAVDCGGPCAPCASCTDGIQNQGEEAVDCGGPCAACATCNDGILNQGEDATDCGGPCPACQPVCVTVRRGVFGTVEDAFASVDYPGWLTATEPSLHTGRSGSGQCCNRTLVRFDLSFIPAGAEVVSATFVPTLSWSDNAGVVNVHRAIVPWTEPALSTYALGPSPFDSVVEASFAVLANTQGPTVLDITPLVQDWVLGIHPNYGVLLDESVDGHHQFWSSEVGTATNRPTLNVCYVP